MHHFDQHYLNKTMSDSKIPLNVYKVSSPFTGKILENTRLTDPSSASDTRHIVIDMTGSQLEYLEGQSLGVIPPGMDENGKPYSVRLYSIASCRKGEKNYPKNASLCLKRVVYHDPSTDHEKRGVASNYICDLKPGDFIQLTGPVGNRFILPENFQNHHYVFIATGTGIAPYRGMLTYLFENGFKGEAWLIFGVPYRTDLLYENEFSSLLKHSNFHFVTAISREEKNQDGSKVYVQHRLLKNKETLVPLIIQSHTRIYICGLKGMEKGIGEYFQLMLSVEQYSEAKKRIFVEVY